MKGFCGVFLLLAENTQKRNKTEKTRETAIDFFAD
jgi:hypothetical protein